jgi:hypothetical protein
MSETDITPALSAEDWREVLPNIIGSQAVPHQTMAIANAALPDDDPRKITRVDIKMLGVVRDYWEPQVDDGATWEDRHAARVRDTLSGLLAKLAALLPPE